MNKFLKAFKKVNDKGKESFDKIKDIEVKDKDTRLSRKFRKERNNYDAYDDIDNEEEMETMEEEVGIQTAQRPESFHHFILENNYKDLEMSIRGYKYVYDKEKEKWRVIRKSQHCFTDEEAEEILRASQSYLSTDVKLGYIKKDIFGDYMMAIYEDIAFLFESIAEYRYGRYGDYESQYKMKVQNQKIFLELMVRIQANFSRAIEGMENKHTHDSVRGQESLQGEPRDEFNDKRYT